MSFNRKYSIHFLIVLLVLVFMITIGIVKIVDAEEINEKKSVAIVFDISGSMKNNDPNRLVIDSIGKFIYSIPSDYEINVVLYNSDIVLNEYATSLESREKIVNSIEKMEYQGYTNTGEALNSALDYLEKDNFNKKTVILFSDGDILMETKDKTEESLLKFNEQVLRAKNMGIAIHVVGIGKNMLSEDSVIFSAAMETEGKYFITEDMEIHQVLDSLLTEQLNIKKNTLITLNSNGNIIPVKINIPFKNARTIKVLITSSDVIQMLVSDYHAESGKQILGKRYAILELKNPKTEEILFEFQTSSDSEVEFELIAEYEINPIIKTFYKYERNEHEGWFNYNRVAINELIFVSSENDNLNVLNEDYFEYAPIYVLFDEKKLKTNINNGQASWKQIVTENKEQFVTLDFSEFPVNIVNTNNMIEIKLKSHSLVMLKFGSVFMKWIVYLLILVLLIFMLILLKRKKRISIYKSEVLEENKFTYVGRLNIYITKIRSEIDIPPLTFNLFRISNGRAISLKEILDECGVTEVFEGSENIFFRPSSNKKIILNNQSNCTVMKVREIIMKNKSVEIELYSKVDIVFEDEFTELMLQYKEL